jgi:hypothetical protein
VVGWRYRKRDGDALRRSDVARCFYGVCKNKIRLRELPTSRTPHAAQLTLATYPSRTRRFLNSCVLSPSASTGARILRDIPATTSTFLVRMRSGIVVVAIEPVPITAHSVDGIVIDVIQNR